MGRNVLLIEPNYKNKYPPMPLMKLSTYYKMVGDNVKFFKGDLKDLVLDDIYEELKKKLYFNEKDIFWESYKPNIIEFLKKGHLYSLKDIPKYSENPIIRELFKSYRNYYKNELYFEEDNRIYDVVCITTLFTFYYDITVDTINFAKKLCKTEEGVKVGGILASILSSDLEKDTGIKPIVGAIDKVGILDKGNDIIVDTLPLDYSILEEIDYKYPDSDSYYAYTTRGCVNRCKFCVVPKLEPNYKSFLPIAERIKESEEKYGAKRDLKLLDNNVLASPCFYEIVNDIKKAGFYKGATLPTQNFYEIAVTNLEKGYNDRAYIKLCVKEFNKLLDSKNIDIADSKKILEDNYLLYDYTATKESILKTKDDIAPFFEKFYGRLAKEHKRYVDFNQGIDSRLIKKENMEKLAELSIKPVRIAFDHWNLKETYIKAVETALEAGHNHLSNYLLYNFDDKPEELYYRLDLNVKLCEKHRDKNLDIYSFPMKYHPIDIIDYCKNRDYIGIYWNRKFIRAIQAVLNSTKGKIGRGLSFFEKAFGKDIDEFQKILYMPEVMIIYRQYFENIELENNVYNWWRDYCNLTEDEKFIVNPIIESNNFLDIDKRIDNPNLIKFFDYYTINKDEVEKDIKKMKNNQ